MSTTDTPAHRAFVAEIGAIAAAIGDRPLDADLAKWLDATYPAGGPTFRAIAEAIETGDAEGWICPRENDGIRWGRVIKAGAEAGRFSVDVVHMESCRGPHHVHPKGEIGMVMPVVAEPNFDGFPEGWYVYGPGSAHHPTVNDGSAYVLYLLPDGAIEFTGR
ncbi:DUF4863 family protein [Pinisolibacter aquiterrae]|uniref:4-hydroxylaminobenzoate lyase n=1 Tax=Pinisolibacter aquiterrae TaxID=2815579 RepID=UPI001C3DD10A|nr:DUF4863 family protein [Pinisolibacter aquiterrae]MBV5266545.1 DUF4863 family protein [Pinisolibacter aquiterrae]MCC8234682.1 DUF4863 family protein [Pinisolibacter aquiterrae]